LEVSGKEIDDNQFIISVKDSGVGMPEETVNRLFNDEQISWEKGTDGETGTGLGLILCKEFAEKHQGSITVESEIGKGSTFSFIFPLVKVSAEA